MILVQNRRLLLSGSKNLFLLVFCVLLVSSCVPKKKVTSNNGPRSTPQETSKPGPKSKVDTIRWTEEVLANDASILNETNFFQRKVQEIDLPIITMELN